MMKNPIEQISKKTWRYWYVDGLVEIGAGLLITLIGVFYLLSSLIPLSPARGFLVAIIIPVVVLGGGWLNKRVIRYLKERLTYPRTGYIEYRKQPQKKRWLRLLTIFSIATLISILITFLLRLVNQNLIPVITGSLVAIYTIILGYQTTVGRFYFVAAWIFVIGLAVSWFNLPSPYDSGIFFCGIGISWMLSGTIALIHYIRTTSPTTGMPEEDTEEHQDNTEDA